MKVDVSVEYNKRASEVTFSSKATQFTQTRPARIGLSSAIGDDSGDEIVELVGENWEFLKTVDDMFQKHPSSKNRKLRLINPFEPATFEPVALFRMIDHFSSYILAVFYPKTWTWRRILPLLNKYEITLKIPDYNFFNPQKKVEFEKLLYANYKNTAFIN